VRPLEQLLSPIINNLHHISAQTINENDKNLIENIKKQKINLLKKRITPSQVNTVRPEIVESWERSWENGLDFLLYKDPPVMDAFSFEKRLKEKDFFIQAANPYIFQLEDMLSNIESYIFLSDENGVILRVVQALGKNRYRLIPGTIWNEQTIGTCAHEMSIRLKSPIQLCGPEHFCRIFSNISCSSAPVFDVNGNLEGTLTIASPYLHCQNSYSLALVVMMADAIQKEFQLLVKKELLKIAFTTTSDAVIVINKFGVITETNAVAQEIFKSVNASLVGSRIDDVLEDAVFVKSILHAEKPIIQANIKIKKTQQKLFSCSVQTIKNLENNNNMGSILTLTPMDHSHKINHSINGFATRFTFDNIIATSPQSLKLKNTAKKMARFNINVLIQGESGTGKEVYAQAIHNENRPAGPFVAVNCAAIPKNLIESELFGYEPGAFTGAERIGKPGKIELANGGTLFLDEIGDMPLDIQAVLLRVLEDKMIMRLGGRRYIPVDFRLVTASNKNLLELVEKDLFREDLYYRISVSKIGIPPLRDRSSDLIQLIENFIQVSANAEHLEAPVLSSAAKYILLQYRWPGNVRQLQNVISYAVCMSSDGVIQPEDLPEEVLASYSLGQADSETDELVMAAENKIIKNDLSMKDMEKIAIQKALDNTNNHIRGAAKILGLSKSTLYRKIKAYGLQDKVTDE